MHGSRGQDYGYPEKSIRFVNITWGYFFWTFLGEDV